MADKLNNKVEIEQFYSVGRTADKLDCSIQFVYQLISTGELKAIKLGTQSIRISARSINDYIESRWIDPETYRLDMEKQADKKPISREPARSNWMQKTPK